jgi:predicted PurR-regulated permease PerM
VAEVKRQVAAPDRPEPLPARGAAPPAAATPAGAAPGAQHPREVRPAVRVRTLVAAALLVLALLGLVFVLAQVFSLVLDFLVAVVIAEGIRPLVARVRELRVPQVLAIVIVYVGLLALITVVVVLLVQPVVSGAATLAAHFPEYERSAVSLITSIEQHLGINSASLGSQVAGLLGNAAQYLVSIGATIAGTAGTLVLVLVIIFLWLVSADQLKAFTVDLFPVRAQPLVSDVLREMGFRSGGYVRAVVINMVVVGLATGIACLLLGLPSPVLLGIFAGLTTAIPMVGAFLGPAPAVLLGFTVSPGFAILVLVIMVVIQLVDSNTVVPMVMGRVLALPALAVVVALIVGFALAGIIGALLAMPVAAIIHVLLRRVLVPYIHHIQGRADPTYAAAFAGEAPGAAAAAPGSAAPEAGATRTG